MDFLKWTKQQWDRTTAAVCVILGLLCILLGWQGVARSLLPTEQIPYLASGAVLGLFLLGIGATLWLSADLRDEWRKLEEIHQTLRTTAETSVRADDDAAPSSAVGIDYATGSNGAAPEPARAGARRRTPLRSPGR